jgi:uncharacterized membrane protein
VALGIAAVASVVLLRRFGKRPIRDLLAATKTDGVIDIQKNLTIQAPVDTVFQFWDHYENFPRIMSHVREVRKLDATRSRWTAEGPLGAPVGWESVITKRVPNRVLVWQSVPGSLVDNAGYVRFTGNRDGSTRVEIKLVYRPPAGELGHHIASWFGDDPKHAMDEDLQRVKSLLEAGNESAYGERFSAAKTAGSADPLVHSPRRSG